MTPGEITIVEALARVMKPSAHQRQLVHHLARATDWQISDRQRAALILLAYDYQKEIGKAAFAAAEQELQATPEVLNDFYLYRVPGLREAWLQATLKKGGTTAYGKPQRDN